MPLWGAALALGLWLARDWIIAFAGAGLLHLLTDLPLHHNDGHPHFWPLTDWVYASPISYWDYAHHGAVVGPIEGLVSLGLCVLLWRRFKGWPARGAIAAIGLLEMVPTIFLRLYLLF